MSEPTREAAERINEAINGGGPSLTYPRHPDPIMALHADCSLLARAYLANPAVIEQSKSCRISELEAALAAAQAENAKLKGDNVVLRRSHKDLYGALKLYRQRRFPKRD